jgi:AraC-like DNA-binding protein
LIAPLLYCLQHPVLAEPLLLDTACAAQVDGIDSLQALLETTYRIEDLAPISSGPSAPPPVRMQAATAVVGDVSLVSVKGTAVTLAVEPTSPFSLLALPSMGWGRYTLEDHQIDNTVGQTVAYLPPRAWHLTNNHTGGTALQFSEQGLLSRAAALSPGFDLVRASAQLSLPFTIATDQQPARHFYAHLLGALAMVDNSVRIGLGVPHPMLRLDDLILRCVAGLLFPQLSQPLSAQDNLVGSRDLRRTVQALMEWMTARLDQPISLSEIEERSHYGRRAIQMGFRAEVGCGPMQWLRRQRLQLAYQQLHNPGPDCTVTSVAHACGYLNLASFSREFRQRFGMPASELLRQARRTL